MKSNQIQMPAGNILYYLFLYNYIMCKLGILYPEVIPNAITDTTPLTYFVDVKYFKQKDSNRKQQKRTKIKDDLNQVIQYTYGVQQPQEAILKISVRFPKCFYLVVFYFN